MALRFSPLGLHTGKLLPWGRGVVIVALTGWGQEDDRRRSKEAGMDDHLVKPVDPAMVEKLLAELRIDSASDQVLSPR